MAQQILPTNTFTTAKWIVSALASDGTHTTIASALTSASSGDTIFIRTGTYTENLTLKAGVNLTAFGSDSSLNATGTVIINGTLTMTTAGSVTISGIQLQTNSAALLAVTGSAASIVNLEDCYLNMTNNTGITFSSSSGSAQINIKNSKGDLGTTGIKIFAHTSGGLLLITNSRFSNTGASTTASTITAGTLASIWTNYASPITSSSTASFSNYFCIIDSSAQNATSATVGGSGTNVFFQTLFSSGSASAISTSVTLNLYNSTISTSNTNAITGAGTLNYAGLSFLGPSSLINVTTQVGGITQGGQFQAPSAGFIGEQISSTATNVSLSNTTAKNITSIVLTAGIWDIGAMCYINQTGNGTAQVVGIGVTTGTLQNNLGIDTSQTTGTFTGLASTLSIPTYRVTLTAGATYYLVADSNFSTGTSAGSGRISATRVG